MKPTASPPSPCTSLVRDMSTATTVGVTHVSLFWLRYPQLSVVTLSCSSALCISLFVIILQCLTIAVLLDVVLYNLVESYPILWRTYHLHPQDMRQVVLTFSVMIAVVKCQQWSTVYVDTSLHMCKDFMEKELFLITLITVHIPSRLFHYLCILCTWWIKCFTVSLYTTLDWCQLHFILLFELKVLKTTCKSADWVW